MAISSLVALTGLIVLVVALVMRRDKPTAPRHLSFAPANAVVLEHLCHATSTMLQGAMAPLTVSYDLSALAAPGAATVLALERSCTLWTGAGTRVLLKGCHPQLAAALWRRAVRAEVEVIAPATASTTLH